MSKERKIFYLYKTLYLCHPRTGGAEGYPKWRQCPPPAGKAPAPGSESARACTAETDRASARPLRLPPPHRDRCCRRSPHPLVHSRRLMRMEAVATAGDQAFLGGRIC